MQDLQTGLVGLVFVVTAFSFVAILIKRIKLAKLIALLLIPAFAFGCIDSGLRSVSPVINIKDVLRNQSRNTRFIGYRITKGSMAFYSHRYCEMISKKRAKHQRKLDAEASRAVFQGNSFLIVFGLTAFPMAQSWLFQPMFRCYEQAETMLSWNTP